MDSDSTFRYGNNVTLKCLPPRARPSLKMFWLKDGGILESGTKLSFDFEEVLFAQYFVLRINNAQEIDSGSYACLATNRAGVVRRSLNLTSGRICLPSLLFMASWKCELLECVSTMIHIDN